MSAARARQPARVELVFVALGAPRRARRTRAFRSRSIPAARLILVERHVSAGSGANFVNSSVERGDRARRAADPLPAAAGRRACNLARHVVGGTGGEMPAIGCSPSTPARSRRDRRLTCRWRGPGRSSLLRWPRSATGSRCRTTSRSWSTSRRAPARSRRSAGSPRGAPASRSTARSSCARGGCRHRFAPVASRPACGTGGGDRRASAARDLHG